MRLTLLLFPTHRPMEKARCSSKHYRTTLCSFLSPLQQNIPGVQNSWKPLALTSRECIPTRQQWDFSSYSVFFSREPFFTLCMATYHPSAKLIQVKSILGLVFTNKSRTSTLRIRSLLNISFILLIISGWSFFEICLCERQQWLTQNINCYSRVQRCLSTLIPQNQQSLQSH